MDQNFYMALFFNPKKERISLHLDLIDLFPLLMDFFLVVERLLR
jgi:hypothetical protein